MCFFFVCGCVCVYSAAVSDDDADVESKSLRFWHIRYAKLAVKRGGAFYVYDYP